MLCQQIVAAVETIDDRFFMAAMAGFRTTRREQRKVGDLLQLLDVESQEWKRRQEEKKGKSVLGAAATRNGRRRPFSRWCLRRRVPLVP